MKTVTRLLAALPLAACWMGSAWALNPGDKVDNFRLLDADGKSHELYYLSDMKAVVLMIQGNGCPIVRQAVPALRELRDRYKDKGVEFLMMNSNTQDKRADVLAEAKEFGYDMPIMLDETQLIGESMHVTRTAEVFVINPKDWTLAYRGPVDDRVSYEKQRPTAQHQYTRDAIEAVMNGQPVKEAKVNSAGCLVNMPEVERRAKHAKISYTKTIAPMLIDNCVTCHRQGGIGPWQMSSYEMVKGFAPMIREVIRTERMPPWHADPHYGVFKNDRALSADEIKTLVHWVEAGAPRGKGKDPLATLKKTWPEWAMGKPDVVLELTPFEVPATGVIAYQNVVVKNPIGRDVWLKGIDYVPGERGVVHHILGYSIAGAGAAAARGGAMGSAIGGYVPGSAPFHLPADTGIMLSKDASFRFQIHYTPNGKVATDVTHVGLYFQDQKPKYPLRNAVVLDPRLKIPANTKEYTASVSRVFDRDALLYSLTPHSHFRGKASDFVAEYPNGSKEVLLSVPKYDFNWQTTYAFATPKPLPKGTRIVHSTTYDNSSQNKANPDPNIEVRWGEQSWEEMIYGNISYRYVEDSADTPNNVELTTPQPRPQQPRS